MNNLVRKHLRFYGRVQGVGFRFTSKYLASNLNLTGWVFNDYDGTVEMEVQGEESAIKAMIERLDSDRFIEIEKIDSKTIPVYDFERSFSVKD